MDELKLTVISKIVEGNFRPVIMAVHGDDNFPDPSPQPRFLTPDEAVELVAEHGRLAQRVRELEAERRTVRNAWRDWTDELDRLGLKQHVSSGSISAALKED